MKEPWTVYEAKDGHFFAARYRGREGVVTTAGGETDREACDRAKRLAAAYNLDRDSIREARRAKRLAAKGG